MANQPTPPALRRALNQVMAFDYVTVENASTYRGRMGVPDYGRAVAQRRGVLELAGSSVQARWEAGLAAALSRHRVAVLEEQVMGPWS